MKKLNSLIFKICLISGFCLSTQYCLAVGTEIIIIKKDDPIPPIPNQPSSKSNTNPTEASLCEKTVIIYF